MPHTSCLACDTFPQRYSLTQYFIDQRKSYPNATGDFNALMLDIAMACKAISHAVAFGKLDSMQGQPKPSDTFPAAPSDTAQCKVLADVTNNCFTQMNDWAGHLAGMVSEELDRPYQIPQGKPRGKYLLAFDPLDGSGNIDVNGTVGSIFSVLRAPQEVADSKRDVTEQDFLQAGNQQVAAGYALYGPTTMLVLSVGHGVFGFTLDPNLGQFMLTHPKVQIPADTQEFAINVSNARFWEPPVKRYVDECLAGKSGERGKDFNMRWVASRVAEAHRILMRGGIFMYPKDTKDPANPKGRLRILYEANPISFLIEQAGGRASTGYESALQVQPQSIHERVGLICGSRSEVERIENYHNEKMHNTPLRNPLFGERGLFRD